VGQPQQKLNIEQLRTLSRDPVCLLIGACIFVPLFQLIQLCFTNPASPGLGLAIGVIAVVSMLAQFSMERRDHQRTLLFAGAGMFVLSTLGMALPLSLRSIEIGFVLSGLFLACGVIALIAIGTAADSSPVSSTGEMDSPASTSGEGSWTGGANALEEHGLLDEEQLPLNITEEPTDANETVQQSWQRILDHSGLERFEGTATVHFAANQRQAHLHVPISPALGSDPEIYIECSDDDFSANVIMAKTYGAALSIRRSASAKANSVEVSIVMVAKSAVRSDAA